MSWLLDVNMILASRWITHGDHLAAKAWIDSVGGFRTCSISELGFIRISLSSASGATWPRRQVWQDHFRVDPTTGCIVGMTPTGRATADRLRMNSPAQIEARRQWLRLQILTLD